MLDEGVESRIALTRLSRAVQSASPLLSRIDAMGKPGIRAVGP